MNTDITQILETLASSQPTAPAIHAPGRTTLTYADLGAQIRYVRERLGDWGIARGDIVVGVIPIRPEMAVACATLPAAATFAPVSPALTIDVYVELLTRLRPKALIVPKNLEHPVRGAAQRCAVTEIALVPDTSAPAGTFTLDLGGRHKSQAHSIVAQADWAYALTTSGTSGRPKLVPRSHSRITLFAQSLGDWLALRTDDVGCHLLPMHHSGGLESALVVPLLRGTSFVCLQESNIEGFFSALDEYQVTWLVAAPTVIREILRRAPEFHEAVARNKLRCITVGSGRLEPREIDRIERTFGVRLLTRYGLTEAKSITADPPPPRTRKPGSVGVPFGNEVAIMSAAGTISGPGHLGEVVVRGPQVFDGYFDDAQATAAVFVDGWFRTGDLGYFDEDGYLFLRGRVTDMINRGGEKVSPLEIDVAIGAIPGVREAAAFAIAHPSLGEEVAAAVVRDGDARIEASDIISAVARRMGPTRVPRRIYFVDQLPRTDVGKVRRSELPRLLGIDKEGEAAVNESTSQAPTPMSPLESALVGLWSTVLQNRSVGLNDDFFLSGGDSAHGVTLLTHVNTVFGVDLPFDFFSSDAATVASMARAIEAARSDAASKVHTKDPDGARRSTCIPRSPARQAVPLSHTQLRMWFLARLDPNDAAYNGSHAYRLFGEIDVDALRRSVTYLARRHEILRTTYTLVDEEPQQFVHENLTVELKCADLGAIPKAQRNEAMQALLRDEMRRVFDLEASPPLRILLVRLGALEHVLLRVMHHIATDGWSSGIFERELSAAYAAFIKGREPELPVLPIQYADYAAWQRQWLHGEVLETQLIYWKKKLADLPLLQLPTDRPRPPMASHRGMVLDFDLPAPLLHGLKALGQHAGATLFMTLLAAFQVLLHRYSGQEDVAVGTAIAGRGRTELEGLIGFFANTLVLRSDLSGNPSFRELLARVRETALGAYTHQDLPFEKLVEELSPARDMSRNPLFQVSFALQNTPAAALALEGAEVSHLPLEGYSARFDMYLSMRESEQGLHARWEYAADLFDTATIERMAGHFQRLLEAIVADPAQSIGTLPLLTDAERHQLLVEWNDTASDYPKDRCIHQLFEEQVSRTPDAVAVVFEGQKLTYAEFNARANQLAHHLIGLGVGPEVQVGICMERSLELIIGLIAILKAGGAYVPLDPSYPQQRLAFMLEDTQAPVLITQQALLKQLPHYAGQLLCLDKDSATIKNHPNTNPRHTTNADNLAYVIYTSGSTGTPKAAMMEHRALANHMAWMCRKFEFTPSDSVLQKTPISFDAAGWEFFAPLLVGGRLVVAQPGAHRDPAEIIRALREYEVTTVQLVPSVFRLLVDEPGLAECTLTRVFCGGEALPGDSAQRFFEHSRAHLYNLYGPTETCIDSLAWECRRDDERPSVPIGRPISNTRIYILSGHREPIPVGVPGELYVGGAGLARGYVNRPELTAERFVPDPFAAQPGARMYRTGDLARYLADGNIEFLGRIDDQVKIRGFRIELGEIETVLAEHPMVRQAVVLVREDTAGDKRLVAYVVPAEHGSLDIELLRALMRERLPEYMRPAAYVLLDQLPLTPNGKIDRKALPVPEYGSDAAADSFIAPRNAIEEVIAEVWREVLKLPRVGVHENFFDLGGHSLLAAQVVARLASVLKFELPLRRMFEAPTIAELAGDVGRMHPRSDDPALAQILREIESLTDEEAASQLRLGETERPST